MRLREHDGSRSRFPAEPWQVRESAFDPAAVAHAETVFFLANGHLGMRGGFEEGFASGTPGTYINGFYEEAPIAYGETAYGYARRHQVMLNVADGTAIGLTVGGERFDLASGRILAYERSLDLARGLLARIVRWRSPAGREVEVRTRRIVSLHRRHVAAIDWSATLLRGEGELAVRSALDGAAGNRAAADDPRIGAQFSGRPLSTTRCEAGGLQGLLEQRTAVTRLVLACAMDHVIDRAGLPGKAAIEAESHGDVAAVTIRAPGSPGAAIRVAKYLAYCSSREFVPEELARRAVAAAREARETGFEALASEQEEELAEFWSTADVEIDGDDSLQQAVRFSLFGLFQSAGRDGRTGIASKGLSGEGYGGHCFWDSEIYVVPFFVRTRPEIARCLLRYRLGMLDKARARAREMNQRGALFPWRTIGGEETSAYYPAGTAQYHIDADVAYAFRAYLEATGDRGLLSEGGAEMLFETARLWADLGCFIPGKGGAFCIDEVTGPDEYTALVNNDLYTNLMARENLEYAAEVAERLKVEAPADYQRIARAIGLEDAEVSVWRAAASRMYVPFDRELGIHRQDDLFLERPRWDLANTPASMFPLLLHYHPLVIYRHQVLKQPDVVLAQVLLGHRFSMAEKKRNFDYYDPLTTGDSSLSPAIQSVAAAELGYTEAACRYLMRTARMDLDDINGDVEHGVHIAAMAGTWMGLAHGFAGLRDSGARLAFAPKLPGPWKRLRFRLRHQGALLEVAITQDTVTYLLVEGPGMTVRHHCREHSLEPGRPLHLTLAPVLECVALDCDGLGELPADAWLASIRSLLAGLRAAGIRIAAVSTRGEVRELSHAFGIGQLIDLEIGAGDVLKASPDPEAFFLVAERLGVPFESCAAVSASSEGVEAIRSARMFSVAVCTAGSRAGADWLVRQPQEMTVPELRQRFARQLR